VKPKVSRQGESLYSSYAKSRQVPVAKNYRNSIFIDSNISFVFLIRVGYGHKNESLFCYSSYPTNKNKYNFLFIQSNIYMLDTFLKLFFDSYLYMIHRSYHIDIINQITYLILYICKISFYILYGKGKGKRKCEGTRFHYNVGRELTDKTPKLFCPSVRAFVIDYPLSSRAHST